MQIVRYWGFTKKVIRANLGLLKNPYKVFLVVTKSCSSRCQNCQIWREQPTNEMSATEYTMLAQNLNRKLSWLNLSGGEPTDRSDLIELIKIFLRNCPELFILNFTSNGLRPERLEEIARFLQTTPIPIIGINVSIDGPRDVHDKLRGKQGGHAKAIESLKVLRSIKKIRVNATMTLFDSNSHLVEETYLDIKKDIPDFKKSELHLNYAFKSEHYYRNNEVRDFSLKNLHKNISFNRSWGLTPLGFIKNIYLKKLFRFHLTKITPVPCSALRSNVYISEHGDLYTCTIWNKKVGSLRENDFDLHQLIHSESAIELKESINKKDCVNCWSPCEAFPSIIDNLVTFIK